MARTLIAASAVIALAAALPAGAHAQAHAAAPGAHVKDATLDKLQADAHKLETQYRAHSRDAKLKLRVADAYYQLGHAYEYSTNPALSPRVRYRTALHDYNVALKYNPGQKSAAAEKKQIEDVYRSMGMPVPKE